MSRQNVVEDDTLFVHHHSMLESRTKTTERYKHYMHKGCAYLKNSLRLILDKNVNDNIKEGHVHIRDLYRVGYSMEAYEVCLKKNPRTNYYIKYLPFLLMINSVVTFILSNA